MKDSLERLIDEEESSIIMDLVSQVPSSSQEHDSSSRVNLITDTVIIPVGNSDPSKRHSAFYDRSGFCWYEGDRENGVPNGQGTMTGRDGENVHGEWRNGELVKGTIQVHRDGQWRTYTMDSMTSHFQYLGGFAQPISGKGNMTVGTRTSSGTFENGEMVMGAEYIESTKQGVKWDVRYMFVVNGEKATLRYSVLDNDEKVYDSLVYGSCSIVNKGNGIVVMTFEKDGEKVTQTYQCTSQQLKQVFSEDDIVADKRFRDVQLVERKTERGERNVTSHHYYRKHQTIDYLNGLVMDAASGVVYQGGLEMSVEGAVAVPVCSGRGKQFDGYEGLLYDGGWLNGVRNGKGVEYVNGKKVYEGGWSNGMRSGEGTEYADSAAWTGVWKNGKKDGKFSCWFEGGMVEEIWSNGVKASSVVTRKDGVKEVRRMVGGKEVTVEWSDGERTYRYANDGKKMVVELVNGGKLYEGGVKENQDSWWKKNPNHRYSKWLFVPDGDGEEYDGKGALVYRGQYWHGYRHYHGEEYENGVLVFEGVFEYDRRKNGKGMEIYGEYQLKGKWKNGMKDGGFVMNYKNGLVFKTHYESDCNNNLWSVYDKTLLYQGSLKDFLPWKGNYYVFLEGRSFPVSTDTLRNEVIQAIGDKSLCYCGHFAVEDDYYCVVKGEGTLFIHGKEYVGVFNTFDYISDCTVKNQGKEVFLGIVRNLEYYAGFHYADYCIEEGLFENGCLKHGYKQLNDNLCSVGDPSVYEKAYTSEGMTFRNTRPSIMTFSERKDSLERIAIYDNPFKQQQDPKPDLQPDDVPTYTLTKNGGMYYLNIEPVSVELEDNGATILVPYRDKDKHENNNEDNHATQIYLKFTCDGCKFTFVKTVIRMYSPLCSIKHPISHSDSLVRHDIFVTLFIITTP